MSGVAIAPFPACALQARRTTLLLGDGSGPTRRRSETGQRQTPRADETSGMTSLLIVTGPPGAGKSSVARLVADAVTTSALIEGDAFFGFLASGAIAPWLPASHDQNAVVTRAAGCAAGEFARGGLTTVFDGVIGPWFLDAFARAAGLDALDYAVLLPPVEVCQHRVATRQGHGFTDQDATAQMHRHFALADIADRHVITDPNASATEIAARVRVAQQQGELRYTVP